jgi:hypothetical protein
VLPSDTRFDGKRTVPIIMASPKTTKFTLRFERVETHELLRLVADEFGMSMNALAEEVLSRELSAMGLVIERDLYGTLELLRNYRGDDIEAGLAAFARAEVTEDDPMRSQMVAMPQTVDALGVTEAFS